MVVGPDCPATCLLDKPVLTEMIDGILMTACGAALTALAGAELATARHRRWLALGFRGHESSPASVRWHGGMWLCVGLYGLVAGLWLALGTPEWSLGSLPLVGYLALACGAASIC